MIPVENIYYMLSYAFKVLNEKGYEKVGLEEFENVLELCSEILICGISIQIKRGLDREYISNTDLLSSIRGKIDVSETIKTNSLLKNKLVCSYDEFSVDCYSNQILKTTLELLLRLDLSKSRKKEIRNILVYFREVSTLDLYHINWNVHFYKNNQSYRMLISICYMIVKGFIQTNSEGNMKLMDFIDEQTMPHLYEKFILEYYRKEFPELKVSCSQIDWNLDDDFSFMLPIMQSDIMISNGKKTLIIDAKYYSHMVQSRFDSKTVHSNNLYQIFTYVKNKDAHHSGDVSGMLLYARSDEGLDLDNVYSMSGNQIFVKSLNLNCDFNSIKKQLNQICIDVF